MIEYNKAARRVEAYASTLVRARASLADWAAQHGAEFTELHAFDTTYGYGIGGPCWAVVASVDWVAEDALTAADREWIAAHLALARPAP